jgi:hypothetical protein
MMMARQLSNPDKDPMTTINRILLSLLPVAVAAGCGSDESPAPEDHTPTTYSLLINDVPVTAPYTFASAQTVRVRIKFFNAAQDDLDDVESEHFGGLAFNPASLATAVRLADHHYQFDVTGGTPGTGTLQVGFGHDDSADEVTFDPTAVTVTGP